LNWIDPNVTFSRTTTFGSFHTRRSSALWDGNGGRVILNKYRMPAPDTGKKDICCYHTHLFWKLKKALS